MERIKQIIVMLMIFILLSNFSGLAAAIKPLDSKSQSTFNQIFLYEKDPTTWEIVRPGAWGKLRYSTIGPEFEYSLLARGLNPLNMYSLIYYPDPWPGLGLRVIALFLTPDSNGVIRHDGSANIGDIPILSDENYLLGGKIWLVLSMDVGRETMIQWNPTEYLFENELITYDDTDM